MIDAEDWEIVFKVYAEQPALACILAQHLTHLKDSLQSESTNLAEVITQIDLGIAALYPHTDFQRIGQELLLAVKGELTTEQENAIRELNS